MVKLLLTSISLLFVQSPPEPLAVKFQKPLPVTIFKLPEIVLPVVVESSVTVPVPGLKVPLLVQLPASVKAADEEAEYVPPLLIVKLPLTSRTGLLVTPVTVPIIVVS